MSEPEDPSRLFEDGAVPSGLRDALRTARSDVASDAQLARLAERLGPILAPPPPAAVSGPSASAGVTGAAKAGLGVLALLAASGGAWLLSSSGPAPSATAPLEPALTPSLAVTPAPAPAPAPAPVAPSAASSPEATPPSSEPAVSAPVEQGLRQLPSKPAPPALSEAALLEQARASLKSDAARALARANEHRARFPRGVLVQEREVIAIQALRQLGRGAEAERRAEAFAKAFPGSAFQPKLKPVP